MSGFMLRACRLSSAYLPDERLSWAATFSLTPGFATVRRSGLPGSAVRSAVALEGYGVSRESALQHLGSEGEITQGLPSGPQAHGSVPATRKRPATAANPGD